MTSGGGLFLLEKVALSPSKESTECVSKFGGMRTGVWGTCRKADVTGGPQGRGNMGIEIKGRSTFWAYSLH